MNKHGFEGWFTEAGHYFLVDGQYGSTGKGLLAAYLQRVTSDRHPPDVVCTNAGPNSGHTFYDSKGNKHVLKQLPCYAAAYAIESAGRKSLAPRVVLTGGAVVDPLVLRDECNRYDIFPDIHPSAALIDSVAIMEDQAHTHRVASTGQGVGAAIRRKLARNSSVPSVWRSPGSATTLGPWAGSREIRSILNGANCVLHEVAQGYSLGINAGFWPYCTTRECTVAQALADAGVAPQLVRRVAMAVRTYPIRVGNTESSSGPCYPDQKETTWDELGVGPEYTTVTGRVRRVFTWSAIQFKEALLANRPDVVFLNFVNYLPARDVDKFVTENIYVPYRNILDRLPVILLGHGPRTEDVRVWEYGRVA